MEDHHVNLLAVDIDARSASKNYTAANVAADMAAGKAGMSSQDSEDEGSSSCWPFGKKKKKKQQQDALLNARVKINNPMSED